MKDYWGMSENKRTIRNILWGMVVSAGVLAALFSDALNIFSSLFGKNEDKAMQEQSSSSIGRSRFSGMDTLFNTKYDTSVGNSIQKQNFRSEKAIIDSAGMNVQRSTSRNRFNLNKKIYRDEGYFIEFYDQSNNVYQYKGKLVNGPFFGRATLVKDSIIFEGKYETARGTLTNSNKYLTGWVTSGNVSFPFSLILSSE